MAILKLKISKQFQLLKTGFITQKNIVDIKYMLYKNFKSYNSAKKLLLEIQCILNVIQVSYFIHFSPLYCNIRCRIHAHWFTNHLTLSLLQNQCNR